MSTNVMDYLSATERADVQSGAGSIDLTAKINNAYSSTPSVLIMPSGTYRTGQITLRPGVAIRGECRAGTIVKPATSNTTLFKYVAPATMTGFEVTDLTVDGMGIGGCVGIDLQGTNPNSARISDIILQRLQFKSLDFAIMRKWTANTDISNIMAVACTYGLWQDQCADTDIDTMRVQNGNGAGFVILGGPGAYDEGTRLAKCSTNGQWIGAQVVGADWIKFSDCSLTTAGGGALILNSAGNVGFVNGELAPAANVPCATIDAGCGNVSIIGNHIILGSFGVDVKAGGTIVHGNQINNNSNVDINLDASNCNVSGNICTSTGSPFSIVEQSGRNHNTVVGNSVKGIAYKQGAASVFAYNVQL